MSAVGSAGATIQGASSKEATRWGARMEVVKTRSLWCLYKLEMIGTGVAKLVSLHTSLGVIAIWCDLHGR